MVDRPFSQAWRDMAYVPRWAILRRTRQQFLAEHSYFVSVYAMQLAKLIHWDGDTGELLSYALIHDIDETVTGDIPGPIKRAAFNKNVAEKAMAPVMNDRFGEDIMKDIFFVPMDIKAIVSVADSIEEICFLMEESLMGNKEWTKPVLRESTERLMSRWSNLHNILGYSDVIMDNAWASIVKSVLSGQLSEPILMKDKL